MKRMSVSPVVKRVASWIVISISVFACIAFAKQQQQSREVKGVAVTIANQYENHFIAEEDVLAIVGGVGFDTSSHLQIREFELRDLEMALENERFIKDAQLFRDLRGNLVIEAGQRRPVARIVRQDGPDAYIGEDGSVLPISKKFTSRVVLLSGDFMEEMIESANVQEEHSEIFELVGFINNDPFWKAQIAQIDVDRKGNVTLYPQVTKQVVEFGPPRDIENKFKKLDVFLKEILPHKGWNHYKTVNLSYKGQIICE